MRPVDAAAVDRLARLIASEKSAQNRKKAIADATSRHGYEFGRRLRAAVDALTPNAT